MTKVKTFTLREGGFVIPGFLLSPTGIMGTVIVLLSLSNVMFYKLWKGAVDDYAQFRADVVAQQKQLEAEAEKARHESERISKDTADGWAAAVAYLRGRPPITVRVPTACDPSGLRPVPPAPAGTDVSPVQQGFGATVDVAECETRINGAVFDAAQIIWLQDWVRKQHEVKR